MRVEAAEQLKKLSEKEEEEKVAWLLICYFLFKYIETDIHKIIFQSQSMLGSAKDSVKHAGSTMADIVSFSIFLLIWDS